MGAPTASLAVTLIKKRLPLLFGFEFLFLVCFVISLFRYFCLFDLFHLPGLSCFFFFSQGVFTFSSLQVFACLDPREALKSDKLEKKRKQCVSPPP